jgi:hypothetical protein
MTMNDMNIQISLTAACGMRVYFVKNVHTAIQHPSKRVSSSILTAP